MEEEKLDVGEKGVKCLVSFSKEFSLKMFELHVSMLKRSRRDSKSQRNKEFAMRLCLLGMPEVAPIKSSQHNYLNMS